MYFLQLLFVILLQIFKNKRDVFVSRTWSGIVTIESWNFFFGKSLVLFSPAICKTMIIVKNQARKEHWSPRHSGEVSARQRPDLSLEQDAHLHLWSFAIHQLLFYNSCSCRRGFHSRKYLLAKTASLLSQLRAKLPPVWSLGIILLSSFESHSLYRGFHFGKYFPTLKIHFYCFSNKTWWKCVKKLTQAKY